MRLAALGVSHETNVFASRPTGYDRFLEAFCAHAGLERFSLVVHGWGAVALTPAYSADRQQQFVID